MRNISDKYKNIIFTLLLCFVFFVPLTAQYIPTKKIIRMQEKAISLYTQNNMNEALAYTKKTIQADSLFVEPWLLLGNIYEDLDKKPEAIHAYTRALEIDSGNYIDFLLPLAKLQIQVQQFEKAMANLNNFLQKSGQEKKRAQAQKMLDLAVFRKKAYANPVPFAPVNIGSPLNTKEDEYINSISLNEQSLYLTLKIKGALTVQGHSVDAEYIAVSNKLAEGWQAPEIIRFSEVESRGYGAAGISISGTHLFFTHCTMKKGRRDCDLYYAKKNGDAWGKPHDLGSVINTSSWESQAAFSADGKTLYFVSNRPGGFGGSDIWSSELDEKGYWQAVKNLGEDINTEEDEMAPFIHPDGQSLYFSSKGHPGMGGFDLFIAHADRSGKWQKPQNLGYPINTENDEINLIVSSDAKTAYFSSNQLHEKENFDMYYFTLPESARPLPVSYIEGIVFDADSREKLSARVELIALDENSLFSIAQPEKDIGIFLVALPLHKDYAFNISKKGYLFYSANFSAKKQGSAQEPVRLEIPLRKLKTGEKLVLQNLFFDTDQYSLKPASKAELGTLTSLLKDNPTLKIEISGHTDNVGTEAYNQQLSEKRAKSVYDYLIEKNIDVARISYKGYGLSEPVETNNTEAGRAKNRRTEIKVTGI